MERLLEEARASHSGVLVLRGEPGLGKSALLEEAVERAVGFRRPGAPILGGVFPVVNRLRLGADWRCDARARPVVFLFNSRLLRESRKRVCVWTPTFSARTCPHGLCGPAILNRSS